jgi:hypothetical protein
MRAIQNARRNVRPTRWPTLEHRSGGPRWSRGRGGSDTLYLSGQPVPESGIYEVIHDRGHRSAHDVLMHGRDFFPPCDQCGEKVRFKLIRSAPYIFEDADFVDEP